MLSASLSRNPVIEVVDAMVQMMHLAVLFAQPEQAQSGKHSKGGTATARKSPLEQIEEFRETLRSGETIDLTTGPLRNGYRAVVTLESRYLNDPSMGDLVDGTFTVVAKVVGVLSKDEGAMSLIRKTALGRLPAPVLEKALGPLNELSKQQGFSLPRIEWEIPGPVIHVLPVAIYA